MKSKAEPDLYAHLLSLGVTKRAAGAIGADLNDLGKGIAAIEATLLSMDDAVSQRALLEARQEIELHLRGHLRSLNTELRSLQRRNAPARSSPRDSRPR